MSRKTYAYLGLICFILCYLTVASAQSRKLVIGFDRAYPPYEFLDQNSKPTGFNVDLVKAIAQRNNWQVEYRMEPWSSIREAFDKGEIDLLAGFIISEARKERYFFSDPHTYIHYSTFLRSGKTSISSWTDFAGKEILIQPGDLIEEMIRSNVPTAIRIPVADFPTAIEMLAEGYGDYAIMPRILGHSQIMDYNLKSIEISTSLDFAYPYAMATAKADTLLIGVINQSLRELEENGSLLKLRRKWFSTENYSPGQQKLSRRNIILWALFGVLLFIAMLLMAEYYRKILKQQTRRLKDQIKQKNKLNEELSIIHKLYSQGPIIMMKWHDNEKEQFSLITENIHEFGYRASDLKEGKIHYRDIIHPDDVDNVLVETYKNINGGKDFFQLTYRILCPDHRAPTMSSPQFQLLKQRNIALAEANSCRIRWVVDNIAIVKDIDSGLRYYCGYLMDVSDLYEHYAELTANRKLAQGAEKSKDIFLSGITDEIGSPIRLLVETVGEASKTAGTEDQQDALLQIYLSAHRLQGVINQIQNYLFYSSRVSEDNSRWFEICAHIFRQIEVYRSKAETKGMVLNYKCSSREIETYFNPQYLNDMLSIVCDNAIKFSDKGVIELNLCVQEQALGIADIRICISDQGIGIPDELLDYITQPFTQIDPTYTRERGGLGLGLATLQQILKICGGNLQIQNVNPTGLRIDIHFECKCRPPELPITI